MQKLYVQTIRHRDRRRLPGWLKKTLTVCAEVATVVIILMTGLALMGAGY